MDSWGFFLLFISYSSCFQKLDGFFLIFSAINLISFFNILMKFLFEKRVNDYFSHGKS